jgi:putative phosphoesterase
MILGVIADTHGLLRPEAEQRLAGVDHIIHAGDIGDPGIVPRLQAIAPVTAIRGNIDFDDWAEAFPETATVTLAGRPIHVLHDVARLGFDPGAAGIAMVIAAHSHRARVETIEGVLFLNPGSAGPRRFRLPVTLATVELSGGNVLPEIHEILA